MPALTILLVEPDAAVQARTASALQAAGRCLVRVREAAEAWHCCTRQTPALVVVGQLGAGSAGALQLVRELRERAPQAAVLLFMASGDETSAVAALRLGVRDYLHPPAYAELAAAVERCLPAPGVPAPPDPSTDDGIVGRSPAITRVRDYVRKVALVDCGVLIDGESGTGKELVASAIHRLGPRRTRPYVALNCAAVPEGLLESELFGYERGAFTGAQARFDGRLARAHGGTLFLDEIGELSPPAQAKILRAIENKQVERLGGRGPQAVDVRIVAATNCRLEQLVADGRFRADLYFRLAVTRVTLPPLRERSEDLPLLARHFLADVNRRLGRHLQGVDEEALASLRRHTWPGNVRELRNLLEAVGVDKEAGWVGAADLPAWFVPAAEAPSPADERQRLLVALREAGGNKSAAASSLNWSRMTLYRKLAKYSVDGGGWLARRAGSCSPAAVPARES